MISQIGPASVVTQQTAEVEGYFLFQLKHSSKGMARWLRIAVRSGSAAGAHAGNARVVLDHVGKGSVFPSGDSRAKSAPAPQTCARHFYTLTACRGDGNAAPACEGHGGCPQQAVLGSASLHTGVAPLARFVAHVAGIG